MAKVVLGMGTSHSPIMSLKHEDWPAYASGDPRNPELIPPYSDGKVLSFSEMLERADPALAERVNPETFKQQFEALQGGIQKLAETVDAVQPEALVIIGDDQGELFFDDNYPAISIYWGDTMRMTPRGGRRNLEMLEGYGQEDGDYPVDSELAQHLISYLMDEDFDIAHSRYLHEQYGGTIGPLGYVEKPRTTEPRPFGMPHAYTFVATRILKGKQIPMVPVTINTCYPPNQVRPTRCYKLGQAIRRGIEAWGMNKRIAVVGSGGLSHFVVDEEIDRMALDAMKNRDIEAVGKLPLRRLDSAASEIRNWITAAGALEHLNMELLTYVPAVRTPAGTGGGWACARWQ